MINENKIEVSNLATSTYIEKMMVIMEENISNEQCKEKFISEGNKLHNTILKSILTKLNRI